MHPPEIGPGLGILRVIREWPPLSDGCDIRRTTGRASAEQSGWPWSVDIHAPDGGYLTETAPSGGLPNTTAYGRGRLFMSPFLRLQPSEISYVPFSPSQY